MSSKPDELEIIRNELNKIVSQSAIVAPEEPKSSQTTSPSVNLNKTTCKTCPVPVSVDKLDDSEFGKKSRFLNSTAANSIDDDILKMRADLNKSYALFQSAGEAFNSIDFNCLNHRIKDLHLSATKPEMDAVMQEKTTKDRLNKLTDIMGDRFRQHPGEFANIPELSTFFKACSQLQHGLESLKRHRSEMDDLGQRMTWATNVSIQRSQEIQEAIERDKESN